MSPIDRLSALFEKFPGIGPRQAKRFVYYLLTRQNGTLEELSKNISALKKEVSVCGDCRRFFQSFHHNHNEKNGAELCSICANSSRDRSILMLVQRDIDLESVEKNGLFNGIYFVLGGSVPILDKEPEKRIRAVELKKYVEKCVEEGLKEIILGTNWNPEGENTGDFVERLIKPITEKRKIKVSHFGKGLSMGSELEYTDPDTLKNALKNRG